MEVLGTSSSLSSDSLRDAFASLDAASAEKREPVDWDGSWQSDEAPFAPPFWSAQRRQWQDAGPSALCGGDPLEDMKRRVEEQGRREHQRASTRQEQQGISAPVPIDETSLSSFATSIDGRDGTPHTGPEAVTGLVPTPSILPPSPPHHSIANYVGSPQKRKRTLQWAARRDKRIARRRQEPPLTRTQAARQQEGMVKLSSMRGEWSGDLSADVTDPSFGSIDAHVDQAAEEAPKGRRGAGKRKGKARMLDLTFSEPAREEAGVQQQQQQQQSRQLQPDLSPPSSQTQSEATSQGLEKPTKAARVRRKESGSSTSSETEEEEGHDEVVRAWKQRKEVAAGTSKRAPKPARATTSAAGTSRGRVGTRTREELGSKGTPIFQGSTFLVVGFWAKVKLFEGLIVKHGGRIVRQRDFKAGSRDEVHCLVGCTHSGQRPAPVEVQRWTVQLARDRQDEPAVRTFIRDRPLVDALWISDCIAKCLDKKQLLSMDKYRIGTS